MQVQTVFCQCLAPPIHKKKVLEICFLMIFFDFNAVNVEQTTYTNIFDLIIGNAISEPFNSYQVFTL